MKIRLLPVALLSGSAIALFQLSAKAIPGLDCPNFWVNPGTHQTECLDVGAGRLTRAIAQTATQPAQARLELFRREAEGDFYLDRGTVRRSGNSVKFTVREMLSRPSQGIDEIRYDYQGLCGTGASTINTVSLYQQGVLAGSKPNDRTPMKVSPITRTLVKQACKG